MRHWRLFAVNCAVAAVAFPVRYATAADGSSEMNFSLSSFKLRLLSLFAVLLFLFISCTPSLPPSSNAQPALTRTSFGCDLLFHHPSPTKSSSSAVHHVRSTILFLPGCGVRAIAFFLKGRAGIFMTNLARLRGYTTVALGPPDGSPCWRATSRHSAALVDAMHLLNAYNLSSENMTVVGVSAGVSAASMLAKLGHARAIIALIAPISVRHVSSLRDLTSVAYVHMLRDEYTAKRIERSEEALNRASISTKTWGVNPRTVAQALNETGMEIGVVDDVVQRLFADGLVGRDGFLKHDPRRSNWRKSIWGWREELHDGFVENESVVAEALNRAYAKHEITAEHFEDALNFVQGSYR